MLGFAEKEVSPPPKGSHWAGVMWPQRSVLAEGVGSVCCGGLGHMPVCVCVWVCVYICLPVWENIYVWNECTPRLKVMLVVPPCSYRLKAHFIWGWGGGLMQPLDPKLQDCSAWVTYEVLPAPLTGCFSKRDQEVEVILVELPFFFNFPQHMTKHRMRQFSWVHYSTFQTL